MNEWRSWPLARWSEVAEAAKQHVLTSTRDKAGHIASSLGAAELTVALHGVLDTPNDVLIWDVGHQAYIHKVLTGRADVFAANRTAGGPSGFPRRSESGSRRPTAKNESLKTGSLQPACWALLRTTSPLPGKFMEPTSWW